MNTTTAKPQGRCDRCDNLHEAEYSHEGRYGEGAIYAVVCPEDGLTAYHTEEGVERAVTVRDALGVIVNPGDTLTVIHYGWEARLIDTGRQVRATGFTRAGNITHDSSEVANGRALRPGCVAVARRDGRPGHEGNRSELAR